MAIQHLESIGLTQDILIDPAKGAVVIDGVSKVFKKSRPLFRTMAKPSVSLPNAVSMRRRRRMACPSTHCGRVLRMFRLSGVTSVSAIEWASRIR